MFIYSQGLYLFLICLLMYYVLNTTVLFKSQVEHQQGIDFIYFRAFANNTLSYCSSTEIIADNTGL